MTSRLTIALTQDAPDAAPGEEVIAHRGARAAFSPRRLHERFLRYSQARLLLDRLDGAFSIKPILATRLCARGAAWIEDREGARETLGWLKVARLAARAARDSRLWPPMRRRIEADLAALETSPHQDAPGAGEGVLYLRADLTFGTRAGGAVGHTASVAAELHRLAGPVLFAASERVPTLPADMETLVLPWAKRWWPTAEWHHAAHNLTILDTLAPRLAARPPRFVYQRHALMSYAGLALARRFGVPLVLEYNGSEIWVARHWGEPLREEALAERAERTALRGADLVSVVSRPLAEEVAAMGVDPARIMVNPNAVDPDLFSPQVDGGAVRRRHGLGDALVFGFIGTFGPWHGAEVLAEAFCDLLAARPDLAPRIRLLLIGDGTRLSAVRRILAERGGLAAAAFTGLVDQHEGPAHLAAADILVSPHVPNPDGTPFFGSPTKLFEYMAMGRPVVASSLGQIAEVLDDGRTALMVPPGDRAALAAAMARLADDAALRARLAAAARAEAVAHHTWRAHVARILARLEELVSAQGRQGGAIT